MFLNCALRSDRSAVKMVRRSADAPSCDGIHPVALRPKGQVVDGEIEELWLDDRQLISRSHPQRDVTLVGLMNELGEQGWELVTYAQPFTGYHGGCYTFKRQK